MDRVENYKRISMALDDAQLKHVQMFFCAYNGKTAVKLASVDNDRRKEKTKAVMDNFKDFATMVKETKTTLIYTI